MVEVARIKTQQEWDGLPVGMVDRQQLNVGWSSLEARKAHNLDVAGSNPAPATTYPPARNDTLLAIESRGLTSNR